MLAGSTSPAASRLTRIGASSRARCLIRAGCAAVSAAGAAPGPGRAAAGGVAQEHQGPARADRGGSVPGDLQRQQVGVDVAVGRFQVERLERGGGGGGPGPVTSRWSMGVGRAPKNRSSRSRLVASKAAMLALSSRPTRWRGSGSRAVEDQLGAVARGRDGRCGARCRRRPRLPGRSGRAGRVLAVGLGRWSGWPRSSALMRPSLSWVTPSPSRFGGGLAPGKHPGRSLVASIAGPDRGCTLLAVSVHGVVAPGDWQGGRRRARIAVNPPTLLGRRAECEALDQLLADVLAGQSRVLVPRGEAGVGKSALLGYVSDRVDGWQVARAVGVESEMELAYAGLHQLCAPLLDRPRAAARPPSATRWPRSSG